MAIRKASAPQEAVEVAERDAPPAGAEEEPDVPLREGAEVVARDAPRAAAAPDARQVAAGLDAPQVAEPDAPQVAAGLDAPQVAAVAQSDGPPQEVVAEVAQPGAPRQAEIVLELTSVADRAG